MDNALYFALSSFLFKGHLKKFLETEDFALFCFLDSVYVLFCEKSMQDGDPRGLLLSKYDAEFLMQNQEQAVPLYACYTPASIGNHSLVFSQELLAQCNDPRGIKKVKSTICKMGYADCMVYTPDKLPTLRIWKTAQYLRIANIQVLQDERKKFKSSGLKALCLLAISVVGMILGFLFTITAPDVTSVPFSNNIEPETYVSVEIDFLTPIEKVQANGKITTTYYLFGNSTTKEYGITSLIGEADFQALLTASGYATAQATPIRLYGTTHKMPFELASDAHEPEQTIPEQTIPEETAPKDQTIVLPNGEEIRIPSVEPMLPTFDQPGYLDPMLRPDLPKRHDLSDNAFKKFSRKVFPIDHTTDLGSVYLMASSKPTREISNIGTAFIIVGGILFFVAEFFGLRALISLRKTEVSLALSKKINNGTKF